MSVGTIQVIVSLIAILSILIIAVIFFQWLENKYNEDIPGYLLASALLGTLEITGSMIVFSLMILGGESFDKINAKLPSEICLFALLMGIYLVITVIVFTKNKKE